MVHVAGVHSRHPCIGQICPMGLRCVPRPRRHLPVTMIAAESNGITAVSVAFGKTTKERLVPVAEIGLKMTVIRFEQTDGPYVASTPLMLPIPIMEHQAHSRTPILLRFVVGYSPPRRGEMGRAAETANMGLCAWIGTLNVANGDARFIGQLTRMSLDRGCSCSSLFRVH